MSDFKMSERPIRTGIFIWGLSMIWLLSLGILNHKMIITGDFWRESPLPLAEIVFFLAVGIPSLIGHLAPGYLASRNGVACRATLIRVAFYMATVWTLVPMVPSLFSETRPSIGEFLALTAISEMGFAIMMYMLLQMGAAAGRRRFHKT